MAVAVEREPGQELATAGAETHVEPHPDGARSESRVPLGVRTEDVDLGRW
jgi:hypothetical protein